MKTALKIQSTNPTTGKSVTKTATYANPNATDIELNNFAQGVYGGLSANTVDKVLRQDTTDITNAIEPVTYQLPLDSDVGTVFTQKAFYEMGRNTRDFPQGTTSYTDTDLVQSITFGENSETVIVTYKKKDMGSVTTATKTVAATATTLADCRYFYVKDCSDNTVIVTRTLYLTYGDCARLFNATGEEALSYYFDIITQLIQEKLPTFSVSYDGLNVVFTTTNETNPKIQFSASGADGKACACWIKTLYDNLHESPPAGVTLRALSTTNPITYDISIDYTPA